MKKTLLFIICLFGFTNVQAQETPQTDETLMGFYVEKHFRSLYDGCGIIAEIENTFKKKTAIPGSLRGKTEFPLSLKVKAKSGVDIANVFNFIFSGSETSFTKRLELTSTSDPANFVVSGRLEVLNFGIADSQAFNYVYRQTCSGLISAAISAKLNVPPVSLKAQMSAEDKATSELLLVNSIRFKSPIFEVLNGNDRPNEKLNLLMRIWSNWTNSNSNLNKTNSPQYLTGFKGTIISDSSKTQSTYGAKATGEGGFAVPVFSIDGNGQIEYSRTTNVVMTSPDVLITVEKNAQNAEEPVVFFAPVPVPSEIINFVDTRIIPSVSGRTELLAGHTYNESVTINGVPEGICNKDSGLWTIEEPASIPLSSTTREKLNLNLLDVNKTSDRKGCTFSIGNTEPLNPASSLFSTTALKTPYPLFYHIVYNNPYQKSGVTSRIKFTVKANVNRQLDFTVTPISSSTAEASSNGQELTGVEWSQLFRVLDLRNQVAEGRTPSISNISSNCSYVGTNATPVPQAIEKNGLFKLAIKFQFQASQKIASITGTPCEITFDVQIPKKDDTNAPIQTIKFAVPSPVASAPAINISVNVPPTPNPTQSPLLAIFWF